jgi:hypothetical protein
MQGKISDEAWMKRLWKWADQYDISDEDIPRDKDTLLKIKHLNLMMVYFGLKKIPADQWPKNISTIPQGEKKRFVRKLLQKGYFPDEIGELVQLEELCISYNHIERLPASIVNLKNLKRLCLCNNKDLLLTFEQKLWIWELERNGADIVI